MTTSKRLVWSVAALALLALILGILGGLHEWLVPSAGGQGPGWGPLDPPVTSVAGRVGAVTLTSADVGLGDVEDTALSTWAGSTNIVTLGTVATGTWNATAIGPTVGGTGLATHVLGDLLIGSATNTLGALAGNATATRNFLLSVGDGTDAAAPSWATLTSTDVGLANVENTALSTWAGSTSITSLGTVTVGNVDSIVTSSSVGLANVENTALSTWVGSEAITTLGTVATGTWQATAVGTAYGGTGLAAYSLGDLVHASADNTLAVLSGNSTATRHFLLSLGDGTDAAAPSWATLTSTDVGLGDVENEALSTWVGSENITTLGTVATGDVSAIAMTYATGGTIIAQPGDNLATRYAEAIALTPGGNALATGNRAALIILPGTYALAAEWTVGTEFVDVLGLGYTLLERGSVPGVLLTGFTINVTANDVRVQGISTGALPFNIGSDKPLQQIFACVGGVDSFGVATTVSGTFTNCTGGNFSFGGDGGVASGTFANCVGGAYSFGFDGTASGTFVNCTGGVESFGGYGSIAASARFYRCDFGGYVGQNSTVNADAEFHDCTGLSSEVTGSSAKIYSSTDTAGVLWHTGDVVIPLTGAVYLGKPTTNGSWRITTVGADLVFQVRITGTWTTRSTITASE